MPPRVLRFRLRMDRFTDTIIHVPGKNLHTADTLSCAPLPTTEQDNNLKELAELLTESNIAQLTASKERLETYRRAQQSDPTCSVLRQYCRNGWPNRHSGDPLTLGEDLLLRGGRVVVPEAIQADTLRKLHQGHQGIQCCRLRGQSSVRWPGMSHQINDFVSKCPESCRDALPCKEPLLSSPLPDYPWQKVARHRLIRAQECYVSLSSRLLLQIPRSHPAQVNHVRASSMQYSHAMASPRLSSATTAHSTARRSSQSLLLNIGRSTPPAVPTTPRAMAMLRGQ